MKLDLSNAVSYHVGAFPPQNLDYARLLDPLAEAAAALAHYDAKIQGQINSELFLAPLRKQDAVASSRMEGTISTVEDVYMYEAEEESGKLNPQNRQHSDTIETALYAQALRAGELALAEGQPFGESLIRAMHQTLLAVGRGARKNPGSYKHVQNYLGDERRGEIRFIPIAPDQLRPAMADLVDFINTCRMQPLMRTAVAHVEFEALHPFEDGNGRIGRMLIPLMLWRLGTISKPHFFISGYFEDHKDRYIETMRRVSSNQDWSGWIIFFLDALQTQANKNTETINRISELYEDYRARFRTGLNSQYHDQALDFVFARPIFRNDAFVKRAGIPEASARAISKRLADASFLRLVIPAAGSRPAIFAFDPLLDILRI